MDKSRIKADLLANMDVLDVLLADRDVIRKAKEILGRKSTLPSVGDSIYECSAHGDIFEREVLEVHREDFTITVTDKRGMGRGHKDRIGYWARDIHEFTR